MYPWQSALPIICIHFNQQYDRHDRHPPTQQLSGVFIFSFAYLFSYPQMLYLYSLSLKIFTDVIKYNINCLTQPWWTYPRNAKLSAPVRSAVSIKTTRSHNTSPGKHPTLHRESVVTIPNKWVSVDRLSPCSTRRPRLLVRSYYVWNVRNARPRSIWHWRGRSTLSWVPRRLMVVTSINFLIKNVKIGLFYLLDWVIEVFPCVTSNFINTWFMNHIHISWSSSLSSGLINVAYLSHWVLHFLPNQIDRWRKVLNYCWWINVMLHCDLKLQVMPVSIYFPLSVLPVHKEVLPCSIMPHNQRQKILAVWYILSRYNSWLWQIFWGRILDAEWNPLLLPLHHIS